MCHSISREIAKPQSSSRCLAVAMDDVVMPGPLRNQTMRAGARFGRLSTAVRDGVRVEDRGDESEGL